MRTIAKSAVFTACLTVAGLTCAADEQPAHRASVDADGVQRVRIEGGSYFFRPERVTVKANVPVELTVSVERGLVPHSFVIDAPAAGIAIDESLSSTPKVIRFTPSAAGSYPYYCRNRLLFLESHREKGMEGVLVVE